MRRKGVIVLKDKFIVERYFCKSDKLQESMNKHFNDGYYPKEIKVSPYQDEVEGFIIYELKE
jgi:hypothetical protein